MRVKVMLQKLGSTIHSPKTVPEPTSAVVSVTSAMRELEESQASLRQVLEDSYPFTGGLRRRQTKPKRKKPSHV